MNNIDFDSFKIKDIFHLSTGANVPNDQLISGNIPRISAKAINNGIQQYTAYIDDSKFRTEQNFISLSFLGDSFYHPYLASLDMKIHILKPKTEVLNKYLGLYLVTILKEQMNKYNYGNQLSLSTLKKENMILPISDNGTPDWEYMINKMKAIELENINKIKMNLLNNLDLDKYVNITLLSEKRWGEFFITDIGTISSGKDITQDEMIDGDIPYVSATSQNNGISAYVKNTNETFESDCISINRNGSVGYAFYHPYPALFSNDCRKLKINKNKYISLFIANQIKAQKDKYNYGYKMGTNRIKRQKILLPADDNGNPDYNYMEQYMINLELQMLTKYLDYLSAK